LGRNEWLTGELVGPWRAAAEGDFFEHQVKFVSANTAPGGTAGGEDDHLAAITVLAHVVGLQWFFGHGKSSLDTVHGLVDRLGSGAGWDGGAVQAAAGHGFAGVAAIDQALHGVVLRVFMKQIQCVFSRFPDLCPKSGVWPANSRISLTST